MKKLYICLVTLLVSTSVSAMTNSHTHLITNIETELNRFQTTDTIIVGDIVVPQVVMLELDGYRGDGLVLLDQTDKQVEFRVHNGRSVEGSLLSEIVNMSSRLNRLSDDTNRHFFDSQESEHQFEVLVEGGPITSMNIHFTPNTLPPRSVSVEYKIQDQWIPLVTGIRYANNIPLGSIPVIEDQETTLRVTLESDHLLGLRDVQILTGEQIKDTPVLAWYAEPNTEYVLYRKPNFGQHTGYYVAAQRPLAIDEVTPRVFVTTTENNPFYNPDYDRDGIDDVDDLCPRNKDAGNADIDNNGRGDVCEDKDQDGHVAGKDNCPLVYNPNQTDIDADGTGDVCDEADDRASEQLPYLDILLFGLLAGLLLWLVYRSTKKR